MKTVVFLCQDPAIGERVCSLMAGGAASWLLIANPELTSGVRWAPSGVQSTPNISALTWRRFFGRARPLLVCLDLAGPDLARIEQLLVPVGLWWRQRSTGLPIIQLATSATVLATPVAQQIGLVPTLVLDRWDLTGRPCEDHDHAAAIATTVDLLAGADDPRELIGRLAPDAHPTAIGIAVRSVYDARLLAVAGARTVAQELRRGSRSATGVAERDVGPAPAQRELLARVTEVDARAAELIAGAPLGDPRTLLERLDTCARDEVMPRLSQIAADVRSWALITYDRLLDDGWPAEAAVAVTARLDELSRRVRGIDGTVADRQTAATRRALTEALDELVAARASLPHPVGYLTSLLMMVLAAVVVFPAFGRLAAVALLIVAAIDVANRISHAVVAKRRVERFRPRYLADQLAVRFVAGMDGLDAAIGATRDEIQRQAADDEDLLDRTAALATSWANRGHAALRPTTLVEPFAASIRPPLVDALGASDEMLHALEPSRVTVHHAWQQHGQRHLRNARRRQAALSAPAPSTDAASDAAAEPAGSVVPAHCTAGSVESAIRLGTALVQALAVPRGRLPFDEVVRAEGTRAVLEALTDASVPLAPPTVVGGELEPVLITNGRALPGLARMQGYAVCRTGRPSAWVVRRALLRTPRVSVHDAAVLAAADAASPSRNGTGIAEVGVSAVRRKAAARRKRG